MTQDELDLIHWAIFDPRTFTPRLSEVREIVSRLRADPTGNVSPDLDRRVGTFVVRDGTGKPLATVTR